jgi:hypothetical protein
VFSLERKDDPILVVHANRVESVQLIDESVERIPRRNSQVVKPGHRVDLVQIALDDRPDGSGNPPSGSSTAAAAVHPSSALRCTITTRLIAVVLALR